MTCRAKGPHTRPGCTPEEEVNRANVFDIGLLAGRLTEVTRWLCAQPGAGQAAVGYFGASTGAAAALWAAAERDAGISAVVSRGGRPDLARPGLAAVTAPTLLIVGGNDDVVLDLNRRAQAELRCENQLAVAPGATHLFEEPGTLAAAAALARDWFMRHLARRLVLTKRLANLHAPHPGRDQRGQIRWSRRRSRARRYSLRSPRLLVGPDPFLSLHS